LDGLCDGRHGKHNHLTDGRAKGAAIYPPELCRAISRGISRQKILDATNTRSSQEMTRRQLSSVVQGSKEKDEVHEDEGGNDLIGPRPQDGREILRKEVNKWAEELVGGTAWDDVSGAQLEPGKVREARAEGMQFFRELNAYTKCPRSKIAEVGGKLIDVRWIDVNKGDYEDPVYRSRLVGREYNTHKDDSLYAATPPLEALRIIISNAATIERGGERGRERRRELMVNDVSRAYFYAPATRDIFIELPSEDEESSRGRSRVAQRMPIRNP